MKRLPANPRPPAGFVVSEGVVRGRLARARALLRERLTRRGVAPDEPSHNIAPSVPAAWVGAILATVRDLNAGRSARVGWAVTWIRISAALLVIVGALCLAAGLSEAPSTVADPPPLPPPLHRPRLTAAEPPVAARPAPDSGRTVVLRGKVLTPEGRPAAGARLSLVTDAWARAVERTASDADGSYRILLPEEAFRHNFDDGSASPRVQITLIATADGFGPAWKPLEAGTRGGQPAMHTEYVNDLRLVVDHPVEGRVVDLEGKPVSGAILEVREIRALAGGGWKPVLDTFKKLDPSPLYYSSTQWDSPINRGTWATIPSVATDAAGRFRLAGLGRDRMIGLRVSGPGIRPLELSVMTVDDVAPIADAVRARYPRQRGPDGFFFTGYNTPPNVPQAVMLFDSSPTIEVERGQTVSGVVRNARTGEPIPHMRLAIASRSRGSGQIDADERGRYRGVREDHESSIWVYAMSDAPDRYLSAVREFQRREGPGRDRRRLRHRARRDGHGTRARGRYGPADRLVPTRGLPCQGPCRGRPCRVLSALDQYRACGRLRRASISRDRRPVRTVRPRPGSRETAGSGWSSRPGPASSWFGPSRGCR